MNSDRLLWIVISALGIAVVALALRHQQGTILGLDLDTFARIAYLLALFVLVGGVSYFFFHSRLGELLRALLFWIVVGGVLAIGYTYRYELEGVSQRVLSELLISRPANITSTNGGASVQIARARAGDFSVQAEINQARIRMLVDTGASSVVLTQEAAKAAGLPIDLLKYDVPIETASGRTKAAGVILDRLAVGNIVERRIPALVSAPGNLKTSLLGMSFLNRLESFEVRGEQLVLRSKQGR